MIISKEQFEQIEAYLRNTMPEEERKAFENTLAGDEALKAELELQKTLMKGIEKEGVRSTLDEIYHEKFASAKVKKTGIFALPAFRMAAGAALLIAAIWVVLIYLKPSSDALYAKFYEAPAGLPTLLGTQDNPQFEEGMVAYKLGEYEKAGNLWEPLLSQMPDNDTLRFYLAANHLAKGNTTEPVGLLTPIANNETSTFKDDAGWYLALTFIKKGNTPEAKKWLGKLAGNENLYSEKAGKLVKRLE